MMEGSESGVLAPSDTTTEVETWVKFSNFPAEFLTSAALSRISSSIGSPVMMDEETYEKLENHKWPPKLRRKLHSRRTFVRILMRVSVTKPLRPAMLAICPQGREYTIRLDYDPTPKICLKCLCAGHFDFECCDIDKESVEIIAEAGGGFLEVNAQSADCIDGFRADIHGEQGAVTTDGPHSYEDSTVVEAALMVDSHILPADSCDIGAAAAPELLPLLPALDHGVQGTLITEGSRSVEDPPVLAVDPLILPPAPGIFGAAATDLQPEGTVFTQGSVSCEDPPELEVDPLNLPPAPCTFGAAVTDLQPEVGELAAGLTISDGFDVTSTVEKIAAVLPPASCEFGAAKAGDLVAVQSFSDRVDDEPLVGKEIATDPLATVGESIAADLQKLAAVAISDGFDEEPTVVRMATVPCLVEEQVVGFIVLFPFEPGPVFMLQFIMDIVLNDYLIAAGNLFGLLFCSLKYSSFELSSFEDFYVVKSSRQHHKWREKTVEQRCLEGDSGSGEGFLGVDMQDADCIGDIFAYIDGVQGVVIIDRAVWYDNPTDVEAALVEDFHNIEQVFFVVKSSNKHHKWREKSDVQGLVCCSNVLGLSGFDEHSSVEIKETSAVLPFSDFGAANFGTSPAAFLQGRADSCFDQDIFEELEVLQSLGSFMAATNSNHDQLIFKIQHKWREKSMDWSADWTWV